LWQKHIFLNDIKDSENVISMQTYEADQNEHTLFGYRSKKEIYGTIPV
jgi:hypothetical protein